jgi:hypothetical protein
MAFETKLAPKFDSRKDFYGKARVFEEDGKKVLVSYNTRVAEIENGKPKVFGLYSSTTTRHIKEFLLQNGFKAESSKQIMQDYGKDTSSNYDVKLRKAIKDNDLHGVEAERYFRFMKKRFPNKTAENYIGEWAVRFKKGNPKAFMDSESVIDYDEVNRHLKEEGQI